MFGAAGELLALTLQRSSIEGNLAAGDRRGRRSLSSLGQHAPEVVEIISSPSRHNKEERQIPTERNEDDAMFYLTQGLLFIQRDIHHDLVKEAYVLVT